MDYQIGNKSNSLDSTLFGRLGNQKKENGNSIFDNNSVGDLLACKLVKGGKEPVLDLNGIQIKTKSNSAIDDAQVGDTIYLKIQSANKNQVSLKIVGSSPATQSVAAMESVTNTQVMQTAEQYSEMIQENLDGEASEEEQRENQKEILRTLSSEEIAQLRMMHIDVVNAELSDLYGMVITMRSAEHAEELNEELGDIVRETLGQLRENIMAGQSNTPEASGDGMIEDAGESSSSEITGTARLNAEGYVKIVRPNQGKTTQDSNTLAGAEANVKESAIKSDKPIVSDEQLVYLIKNGLDLTIANFELSKNSVNEESPSVTLPFSNKVWNDIFPQVTGIIEAAGMSITEQSQEAAKFMLTHELPITTDSLRMYMAVNSINQRGVQVAPLEMNIEEQIRMGNLPKEARISGSSLSDKASQLIEKVNGITDRAIDTAVQKGKPLSISYLYNSSMRSIDVRRMHGPVNTGVEGASLSLSGVGQDGTQPESTLPLSANPSAISARRQMEEIRMSMTMEAALRLIKQDINIDAKPIAKVIEELRDQENSYYDNMLSSKDLHDIPKDVDMVKETMKETDAMKTMPEYVLGEMVKRPSITVGELYETGRQMKYALAGAAYETMMTKPRSDMGDSMQEAFQNVNEILQDMNLDRNEENQRAIRILAYNEMELNQNNLTEVKMADAKVNQMFETLTPQIVLNMIRDNKNPLNMTVDGMNEEITKQKEIRGITDEQKFSEFLYQMDRNNSITEEERQSFIGIYRLLDKVQKSHGKDIGAVIRNGQEVTLKNLFAADKSRKSYGMDVAIDESFGERTDVSTDQKSILDQINTAYHQTLTDGIMRHLQPGILKNMEAVDYENMSFEQLHAVLKAADAGEGQNELASQLSEEVAQALNYESEVATMLEANNMTSTVTNIIAAQQVVYGEDGIYGMIRGLKQNLSKDARERVTAKENEIAEHFDSKDDVIYGLESVRSSLSEEVHNKELDGTITSMDIQSLKYINAGMPIAMRAVEEEVFRIPFVIDDQVHIMKVSILQDGSHAGNITTSLKTAKYGELEAFLHVSGNQVEGYVTTEDEMGQNALEENELTIRSVLAKVGLEMRDVRLDGTKPMLYGTSEDMEEVTTSKLYKVAKQFMTAIKLTGIASDN